MRPVWMPAGAFGLIHTIITPRRALRSVIASSFTVRNALFEKRAAVAYSALVAKHALSALFDTFLGRAGSWQAGWSYPTIRVVFITALALFLVIIVVAKIFTLSIGAPTGVISTFHALLHIRTTIPLLALVRCLTLTALMHGFRCGAEHGL